ncbi:putative methyltransferase NSUN7 isoform X2 [Thalassophryne amazonica]|nr:putative methyltransferase NSUN7 isoform X2 [Thalassophryne amazonica]
MVIDSCFHTSQHIPSDLLPLVMVMLFDFQDQMFLVQERPAKDVQECVQEVRDLERMLHRCKTKLAASLARCRVTQSLQSISCVLPEPVRTKHRRAKLLPLFAWVNTLKNSVDEVCEVLRSVGLCETRNICELRETSFCRDLLCPDTLVFSQHALLQHRGLAIAHKLNIQDRSVCLAVSALRPLLTENSGVLVAGAFSALTAAHIALTAATSSARVLLCGGDHTPLQVQEIKGLLAQVEAKNVKILPEGFTDVRGWDAVVQSVKVIIVLPQCSSSALNDPVPTIHSEHGDWNLLQDLSCGSVSENKMQTLTTQQGRLLAHTLTFSNVQTVLYCTRSMYEDENEQLVKRVLDKARTHSKLLPFRLSGPVFSNESQMGRQTDGFFKLEPSKCTNGCFIARLTRQVDPSRVETVQEVLARAAAMGLLGEITAKEQSKNAKKVRSKKKGTSKITRKIVSGSTGETPEQTEKQDGQDLETDCILPIGHLALKEHQEGDVDLKGREEEEDVNTEEGQGGNERRKKRGHKKQKHKLKRRSKQSHQSGTASMHHTKSLLKKLRKSKVNQHHNKQIKSKTKKLPPVTLPLASSDKASHRATPASLDVDTFNNASLKIKSQKAVSGKPLFPVRPGLVLQTTSDRVRRQNTESETAKKKILNGAAEPKRPVKAQGKVVAQEEVQTKPVDFVLPPITSLTSCSQSSRSGFGSTTLSRASFSVFLSSSDKLDNEAN